MPTSASPEFSWPIPEPMLVDADLTLLPWRDVSSIAGVREDLLESSRDPRMVRWTQVPSPYTEDHLESFLEPPTDALRWAIVLDGRYCGNVGLRLDSEQHRAAEFGYSTSPWARGRGVMRRAVQLVTDHAFAHGIHRLVIKAGVDNAASRHVAEQAGYTFEGVSRGGELLHGEFHDLAQYSRLATD